jgi:flavin reductase (DIM6/NTAB) family NADH-FMN oxidoreductase RutF
VSRLPEAGAEPGALPGFAPGPETVAHFRHALGRFATGVTVVTAMGATGPVGITANSFASVSLDPPLVLWSPARASRRFEVFAGAPAFAIHILEARQEPLARHFVRHGHPPEGIGWQHGHRGVPVLPDCLARFDCALHACHDGGDHAILVGRVLHAVVGTGAPLVFLGGDYGGFGSA